MCGRFAQATDPKKLAKQFDAQENFSLETFQPGYNIAPTSLVPTVRIPFQESKPVLEPLKWGLVPVWAKDPAIGNSLANARAETVAEKPSFRSPFKKQRCLVPIDGFFEWNQETKPKQPCYFSMKSKEPFALAGLWEYWKQGNLYSFTLITTEANSVVGKIHDRMPVIVDPADYKEWLDPNNQDPAKLQKFLKPYPPTKMTSWLVSTYMSNARNQGPECIKPIEA